MRRSAAKENVTHILEVKRGLPWWLIIVLMLATAVGGFLLGGRVGPVFQAQGPQPSVTEMDERPPDEVIPIDETTVVSVWNVSEILKPASELITLKYHYTDADVFENYKQIVGLKIPMTTNKTVFTYDGVVSLGYDFSRIGIRVNNDAKEITVSLPKPTIIANEIDAASFQYYDVVNSVFNPTSMGDVTELVSELKAKKAEKVMQSESILKQTNDNARSVITSFLNASELTHGFTVVFKDNT